MQSSERLGSPCSSHRATLAVYLTCRLSLLSVSNLLHSHSLLLSPEGSVWDIRLFSIYGMSLQKFHHFKWHKFRGLHSHHFDCVCHDVNSTATHESLKPLTWFKESFRMGVWHLLKSFQFNYKISIFRRIYSMLYFFLGGRRGRESNLEMFPRLLTLSHKSSFIFKALKCIIRNCPHLVVKYIYL